MLTKIKSRLPSVSVPSGLNKPQLMAIVGGVVLAAAIILSLWNRNQGYVALYGSQEHLPVSQVVDVLGAENIAYRINPDNGQILVSESKLPQARMALAAKGISAATPDGYELMDKEEMLGSSQFIQNVRYKRSLEGELAKSIMALDPVENARVHLGLNESSSFVLTNKPTSSASVMVQLHYGRKLDEQQVASVIQLVAGSVPGMQPGAVRVVDQSGNLLSDGIEGPDGGMASKRMGDDVMQRIREDTTKNITSLLTSLVGPGNFRISVAPTVDLSRVEETQERLGKDPRVSDEQLSQENTTNEMAFGIPGSLSNRPVNPTPQAPANPAEGNPPAANAANNTDPRSLSSRSQEQRKYAFDRDIRHIRHPGYKLEKLSVAVVLNQAAPALAKITPEQLTSMTRLVESAAGIEKARGDALTLDVLTFTAPADDVMPDLKWWQDPSMQYWGQNGGIGLLALLTLLFGVRPLVQRFGRRDPITLDGEATKKELEAPDNGVVMNDDEFASLSKAAFNNNEDLLPPQSSGLEAKVEFLQLLAQSETERVAEVLKQWINSNDRSNSKPE
ncbi:TPA: flagellar M-ring protein FliF [Citrobacter koseri]|uniref:flagellar basal-body MS-ring/collar protein FliF n=1 Tax=Citrobacter TaxID=544 RepID=UPI000E0C6A3C|nr:MULTISPECIES: flagellar basal-body MS-ring/collar protein FliF [Citrobacter]AYY72530.1 flagellar M-ring protein FliF [Citrobacter koseri]EMD6812104.1 flagellar M-ring protein FliF [Citrobacter koseri]MBJ8940071.1 flagellar M-ring protein FliF [Citrobacter koseri]MDM2991556.1 flagellar basal-body MS-ring/collar protein FliF [Citrobacter sp. CK190]QCQ72588.1 flagellar M-ring protein FliF [Citrobacter sp. TBCP-5362]